MVVQIIIFVGIYFAMSKMVKIMLIVLLMGVMHQLMVMASVIMF